MQGDYGIDLSAATVLEHVERKVAAAWLQTRAAVPMHYVDPHKWPNSTAGAVQARIAQQPVDLFGACLIDSRERRPARDQ